VKWRAFGLIGVAALAGCESPFGPCFQESVEVSLAGSLDGASLASSGRAGPGNIATFAELKAFAIDGQTLPGQRVAWTVDGLNGEGYLAVVLPGIVAAGQSWAITSAFVGGGWGVLPGDGSGAAVSARFGSSQATAATGTVSVLALQPLRVGLELDFVVGAGVTHAIRGNADFRFSREEVACD